MDFGVLGPLAVWDGEGELPLGPAGQRALLAVLLIHANEVVPTARVVDELWGERPPARAVKTVQVYVSQLRKLLGEDAIETRPAGYLARVEAGALDREHFEQLLEQGRTLLAAGAAAESGVVLVEALGLWRGPALADFQAEAFARDEIGRLEELRLVATSLRIEADLAQGRHAGIVPELEALIREHPYRENLRGLLMLALYRSGRQADALAVYQQTRATLVDELGLDPNESLQQLEQQILRHDPLLDAPTPPEQVDEPAAQPAPTGRRRRRIALAAAAAAVVAAAAAGAAVLLTRDEPGPSAAAVSADSVGVFDSASGEPSGEIEVGASPGAVASGGASLWVANLDANTVSRLDPDSHSVTDTIQVGNAPAGIAYGGGFAWVTNSLDGTVMRIDPRTNTWVEKFQVGNGPTGIAADSRYVWVANSRDGTVTRIDQRTGKRKTIPIGESADGVAVGFESVWVTDSETGHVVRLDARSGAVAGTVMAGNGPAAVAVGLDAVWVANRLDGTVTRIDPASMTVRRTIPVGDAPSGVAVTDGAVWVSNELAGTLSRIDPSSNTVSLVETTGNQPTGLAVSDQMLFVAVRAAGHEHRGGTLEILAPEGSVGHVDPPVAYVPPEAQIAVLTNDGLTGYRKTGGTAGGRLVADLAVSVPDATDGGRTYTFQLRPGISYSNGKLVAPQDFRYALERSLALQSPYGPLYASIVGAPRCLAVPKQCDLSKGIVTDALRSTVTFHLRSPDPDFPHKLAIPAAFAVPTGTPLHPRGFVPATGPYRVASLDKRSLRLVRNPMFHEWSRAAQPDGYPDVIVEQLEDSADADVLAVLRGSADLTAEGTTPSERLLATVRTQHASQLKLTPWSTTRYLFLNTRIPPFDDRRARQALALAIDRQRLKDLAVGSDSRVTCQVLPANFDGYEPYCPYTQRANGEGQTASSQARARRLVRESGTDGQKVTVWIPFWLPFTQRVAAGRYVVSVLESLGYRARLRHPSRPFNPYPLEDRLGVQIGFGGWAPDYFAPATFFQLLTCDSYNPDNSQNENWAEFCNRAIDKEIALAQSLQATDPQAASRLWAKVDRDVTDQAPWVTYANLVATEVVSERVGNYQFNPMWGTLLGQLWVK